MSAKRENAAIIGVGVAACGVCCAGPILGALAALGLGAAAGFALFGALAIVIGAALTAFVLVRRRHIAAACTPTDPSGPMPLELSDMRARS